MTDFSSLLAKAPTRALKRTLVRAVASRFLFPQGVSAAPDFLYTSGKPNRFNIAGNECLYLSETEKTALVEYRRQFRGLAHGAKQPVILYYAEVRLRHVLDLADRMTRRSLHLTLAELEADWGGGLPPSVTQRLGEAVARQSKICAIRYRSVAAAITGSAGYNLAIFRSAVQPQDFVRILGATKKPLQEWP
jgi:RES domain-containing protein